MNDVTVLLVIYGALFLSSPLIVVLHELGHAFAYLALTKPSKIDIYIGSYADAKNNLEFKIGKIQFHIKKSVPFIKGIGLCISNKPETNYLKYAVILVAGSVFTLISASLIALIAFSANAGFLVQVACYIFLALSFISLLSNLFPRDIRQMKTQMLKSDGSKLRLIMQIKGKLPEYVTALELLGKKDYKAATGHLQNILETSPQNREILGLLAPVALEARAFGEAEKAITLLENRLPLSTEALFYRGCLYSLTKRHDEAIDTYSTIINKKDKNHLYALNNLGYELVEKGAHQVAARALERAIKLNPQFNEAYATLGYSKILQGELEEGKRLAKTSLELNAENALAYKALGIYYTEKNNLREAAANFEKARRFDEYIDLGVYQETLKLAQEQA